MLIEHGTGHFTVNNGFLDYFGKIYEHILTWRIKKYVDRYYGVSEACNTWLKHYGIQANGVFYNAIDSADARLAKDFYRDKYPKDTLVISYAGRLIKEKGVLNLLEAFTVATKENPKVKMKLLVAGSGPLLEEIKQNYDDPSIELLGRLDFEHMLALYNRTDIFVYPSLYPEGLPTSILEAGLMDCAVIATPRGGTAEVIESGQHGIITDGSTGELSEAITHLAADAKEREALASALKHRVENVFNWKAVAKQVDKEINSLNAG
jgi:glycosyltransferase involved in cell wall biosynthesis